MNLMDLSLTLRLALQAMAMVSNFHLIVSFNDFGFGQLLTSCDVESLTFDLSNIGDQAL